MNGRCTADPLDHADDVCEFCGDEFCSSCLIKTRNGKGQLICRECAISNSGIKGSRSSKPRVSKSQVERSRVALEEAKSTRRAKSFHFFDEVDDYVAPDLEVAESVAIDESGDDAGSRSPKRRFALRRKTDDAEELAAADSPADPEESDESAPPTPSVPTGRSTPATTLIESGALASAPPGTLPASQLSPEVSIPPDPGWPIEGEMTGSRLVSSSHTTADPDADPEQTSAPVADSLASRLRSHPSAPTSPATDPLPLQTPAPAPPAVDTTAPVHATVPAPAPSAPPAPLTPPPAVGGYPSEQLDVDPFATPADAFAPAPPVAPPAMPVDVSFPAGAPATADDPFGAPAASFQWATSDTAAGVDAGTDLDRDPFAGADPFGGQASMPMPANVAPPADDTPSLRQRAADQLLPRSEPLVERRSDPTPTPAVSRVTPPAVAPPVETTPAFDDTPSFSPSLAAPVPASATAAVPQAATAAVPQAATAAVPQAATPAKASADTDANGNWIPPLLRGMAPVAERRADQLPRRRQQD